VSDLVASDWLLLQSGAGACAFNMALDEALLESMPRLALPVLRFYSWAEPAASFGYFQKYAEVERLTFLRPLVRRPTAGGIVPHEADWTYSLVFPESHEWYDLAAIESYRRVHEWIRAAFENLHVPTMLATSPSKADAGQCFSGHERFDLLWRGQKIAGAAQRRKREGLLVQGSVQPGAVGVGRADWEAAMCRAASMGHKMHWLALDSDQHLEERASELANQKYSQTKYTQKR
jgi:lipoate-protein ligase A